MGGWVVERGPLLSHPTDRPTDQPLFCDYFFVCVLCPVTETHCYQVPCPPVRFYRQQTVGGGCTALPFREDGAALGCTRWHGHRRAQLEHSGDCPRGDQGNRQTSIHSVSYAIISSIYPFFLGSHPLTDQLINQSIIHHHR